MSSTPSRIKTERGTQGRESPDVEEYCTFYDRMRHSTMDCRSLRRHLQELKNRGYLKEFILKPRQPLKTREQKEASEASQ